MVQSPSCAWKLTARKQTHALRASEPARQSRARKHQGRHEGHTLVLSVAPELLSCKLDKSVGNSTSDFDVPLTNPGLLLVS